MARLEVITEISRMPDLLHLEYGGKMKICFHKSLNTYKSESQ